MDLLLQNFLFRNPQYYHLAYPEPNDETASLCQRIFDQYLPQPPGSILDVGCGTGRVLQSLSKQGTDCWGIDFLPDMIEFARSQSPQLHLQVGDARSARLGRTFDAIVSLGSALMYAVTNDDVDRTFTTFAAHAHEGTLLILDIGNAASYLGTKDFRPHKEIRIDAGGFVAHAHATYQFDRRRQLLIRRRVWKIDGQPEQIELCEHRLFFPAELEHLLEEKGFKVLGMFDNAELKSSELAGPRLFVVAAFQSNT